MNLVVVSRGFHTEKVFKGLFDKTLLIGIHSPFYLNKDDCVMFEGGTDISPKLYGEQPNSYVVDQDRGRDIFESNLFRQAKDLGIPMIGICRGSQLLCALSGGKLVQHVSNHGVDHLVDDYKGRSYMVTSSHHQMMLPGDTNHKVLAKTKRAQIYIGEYDKPLDVKEDAETVWFPDTKCLAIQSHPEWQADDSMAVQAAREYVSDFILNKGE